MKRIEIKLSLSVVAPLLDVIKQASDQVSERLVVTLESMPLDDVSKEVWQSDLLEQQTEELKTLLGLFDTEFFASGAIVLDATNAERVIRACSTVRLVLREKSLVGLDDESLESGEVDIDELQEPLQKSFMCYIFLATLQELIIQHLDSSILEG